MKLSILVIGVVISIVGILLAIDNTNVIMLGARITVYPYLGIGLIVLLVGAVTSIIVYAMPSGEVAVSSPSVSVTALDSKSLNEEEELMKKHSEDSKEPLISALIGKYVGSGINYPRQYLERKIQYKANIARAS
jgi:hypothetical protein